MPDISMCLHRTCPQRKNCTRHEDSGTKPNPHWQAYAGYQPTINGDKVECDGYWPKEKRNGNDG